MAPILTSRRAPLVSRVVGVLLFALVAACGGEDGIGRPASVADGEDAVSLDRITAERIVADYFAALLEGRTDDARALLARGPRSDASDEELQQLARELPGSRVRSLDAMEVGDERMVFRVELDGQPAAGADAERTRWAEVIRERSGWRIARVGGASVRSAQRRAVSEWTHVHLLEAGISLDVPFGWVQRETDSRWAPPGENGVEVEVSWEDVAEPAGAMEAPSGGEVLRRSTLELDWATAIETTLRLPRAAAPSGTIFTHEIHAVVRPVSGTLTVHLVGRAGSAERLSDLEPVVRRMLRSVEIHGASSLTTQ